MWACLHFAVGQGLLYTKTVEKNPSLVLVTSDAFSLNLALVRIISDAFSLNPALVRIISDAFSMNPAKSQRRVFS